MPPLTAAVAGSVAYCQLNTTSSAENGWPSCHLTPGLSFQVTDLASAARPPFGGEDRVEMAVDVPARQRLVENARGVLVLGAGGEMRVEQGRPLPPQQF